MQSDLKDKNFPSEQMTDYQNSNNALNLDEKGLRAALPKSKEAIEKLKKEKNKLLSNETIIKK